MLVTVSLICSHLLFWTGLYGLVIRKDNLILTMVCLELSLLGVAFFFSLSGLIIDDSLGFIIFFVLLTLAGVESALGLAFVITYYRIRYSVS